MLNPPFEIHTDAINAKGDFDPRYTCDSDNSSPELRWANAPEGTESFAVLLEDPDAPGSNFTHWLIYNIPALISHLPAGIPAQESLPNGIRQGVNGYKKLGYGGPCPPAGEAAHSYTVIIYALSATPEIPARATREILLGAIQPLILASARLHGRFKRRVAASGLKRAG